MLEGLVERGLIVGPDDRVAVLIEGLGGVDRGGGGIVSERDVSELRIVGRAGGASWVPCLDGIGVHVVAGVLGDRIGEVPGVGQREVVGRVGESDGVLIEERGERNGVGGTNTERGSED